MFETLYEKEKECDKIKGSHIITENFAYAININNITVALYLLKKYVKELYYKNEMIIDSILFILNEYSESNGAVRYHHGISHLEELLYFLEIFLKGFSYSQCFYFLKIFIKISKCQEWDNEELDHYDPMTRQKIIKAYMTNKLRTHFLVYSVNPLKIIIALTTLYLKITERFPSLEIGKRYILPTYLKFAQEIIINYQDIEQVRDMLNGKSYFYILWRINRSHRLSLNELPIDR